MNKHIYDIFKNLKKKFNKIYDKRRGDRLLNSLPISILGLLKSPLKKKNIIFYIIFIYLYIQLYIVVKNEK